ncbi:OmpA family protein [Vicingaceae bacterium]|nr:OmpA family protein [Vicingaceae bacterium]
MGKERFAVPDSPLNTNKVSWSHVVYFEKDKFSISENELLRLDQFIEHLPLPIFYSIKVEGHADQDASIEHNLQLSQKRADVVKERMSNFNLQNIYTSWSGEREIIYLGVQEEGKSKNRRVTITVER